MFLKKCLLASVLGCLMLPAWAFVSSDYKENQLLISTNTVQKVDHSLQKFIQRVLADSPAVQAAQTAVDVARARSTGANFPLYNPDLELDVERTDINTTSIGFSQTLDWSDRQEAQARIAAQNVQVAIADLKGTQQRIAVEILGALAHYFTAQEMQMLALRRSQLMKGFIDTVKQRQAAGDMGALESTLAQVSYSEALMQQAASESELAEAVAALQAVTGLNKEHWPQLPNELAPPPTHVDDALLESLPELIMLRSRMKAAKSRIDLVKRENSANPTIGIRAGREDSQTLLGLSLEIPLFVRNSFKDEVLAASHEAVGEELAYRSAYRRAKARLEGGLGRFKHTSRAWRAWIETGSQAHQQQIILLDQMWKAGELTATDYLIQAKQNIDVQSMATTLKGSVWQAAIAWLDASGQVEHWLGIAPIEAAQKMNFGE